MKIIALALVALLAAVSALPSQVKSVDSNARVEVEDLVREIIESLIRGIQERGLDPLARDGGEGEYIVSEQTGARGYFEDLLVTGLSNIVVNDVSFGTKRWGVLSVDLSAPRIAASIGSAGGEAWFRSRRVYGEASGSLAINDLRVRADISLGLTGYLLEDVTLDVSLGGIDSDLNISILGRDLSERVNRILGETLPNLLKRHRELLNGIVGRLIVILYELLR